MSNSENVFHPSTRVLKFDLKLSVVRIRYTVIKTN